MKNKVLASLMAITMLLGSSTTALAEIQSVSGDTVESVNVSINIRGDYSVTIPKSIESVNAEC